MLPVASLAKSLPRSRAASVSMCYAEKGFYTLYPAVKRAQDSRLELFEADRTAWVGAMVKLVATESFFRWFDSGDLQSVEMLEAIVAVARATPNTRHWLATRERGIVKAWLACWQRMAGQPCLPHLRHLLRRNPGQQADPMVKHGAQGHAQCCRVELPGTDARRRCGDCRACWSQDVALVTYHAH